MASVKTITLPDGSSYDFKATYDIEGNNISETYINKNEKGAASGVAPLNSSGKIDETYLPASDYVSESGSIVSFQYPKNGTHISSLKVNINPVQSGSGDPSPTNIRPITGWTEVNIVDDPVYCGVISWNQLVHDGDFSSSEYWSGNISISSNVATFTAGATNNYYAFPTNSGQFTDRVNHVLFVTYEWKTSRGKWFKVSLSSSINTNAIASHTSDSYTADTWNKDELIVKPTTSGVNQFRAGRLNDVTAGETFSLKNVMILDLTQMFGSTVAEQVLAMETQTEGTGVAWVRNLFPSDYYAYNVGTKTCVSAVNGLPYRFHTITFPDAAGTVYGGTLDVTTGVLTVTHKKSTISELGFAYNAVNTVRTPSLTDFKIQTNPICSAYQTVVWSIPLADSPDKCIKAGTSSNVQDKIYIKDTQIGSSDTTWLSTYGSQTVVYELATPETYVLTAEQVTTLLGQNYICADAGEVEVAVLPTEISNYIKSLALVVSQNSTTGELTLS